MSTKFPVFMHITGFPGCGKTTIGNEFDKNLFTVQDLDKFLPTVTKKNPKAYVESKIAAFLLKKHTKPIIFVGTACLEPEESQFPVIKAQHLIWLDVTIKEASIRAVKRQLDYLCEEKHRDEFLAIAKKMSQEDFAEYLNNYYSFKKRSEDWKGLLDICLKKNYQKLSADEIKKLTKKEYSSESSASESESDNNNNEDESDE